MEVWSDEIGGGEGDGFWWSIVAGFFGDSCQDGPLGVSACYVVGSLFGCCDQSSFAKVVFRLQVLDLGAAGTVECADSNGEDCVSLEARKIRRESCVS